ncbi:acetylglutamate kinase [Caldicellulosiruptor acetigenus I77R1B]|uniref:Acetylglutamate kinase n=2 Tax=Caldicellulosiruptor TaxID=44000 RepID=E4QC81_CALH1|nr:MULTISPECIES: acetylglutamate kinase [Caldicellulosiruptor]ADQ07373.1 acetylglutamate kinase [Caldicellulosiruptor hydrothermalis 108]ADQ40575.1 acetylglutamate kinase [Caldicellulosiruptor acetigenus I77R1B]WAM35328.1 acetylglutamate kinase [Caldicellulosiruptor acetigenus]
MYEEMDTLIEKASILIEALPYIQKLYGKTVVIKYGGNAMINEKLKNWVMEDITLLKYIGVNPIVVHGGGPDINSVLKKLNVESQFVNGLRVTDMQTMEVAQMVLVGKTNKELVSMLNQKGGKAIGICGIDGNLIQARKHYEYVNGEKVDLGYVGEVVSINAKVLEMLAKDEYIPVVAPIGVGEDGTSYNINADTVAAEIAKAIKAEKLMFMTDVEGLKYDKNSKEIISAISADEVLKMIDEGKIDGGMIPKVLGCIDALKHGVNRTHILDGRIPHCILLEIFTDKGIGTMIHL